MFLVTDQQVLESERHDHAHNVLIIQIFEIHRILDTFSVNKVRKI